MKDKLYSRPRIKLPNFREYKSIKAIFLIMFFTIIIGVTAFLRMAFPIFKSSCETAASSNGIKIINTEVNSVMKNYTYNDLISIEKDSNGNITLMKADVIEINKIVSEIISNIQKEFDKIPRLTVAINMGSVSGISILKNVEPKFDIELESAGTVNYNINTKFESVGINQTYHKIFLELNTNIGILTPFSTFGKDINTEVLLTEAVIVGKVPESYFDVDLRDVP